MNISKFTQKSVQAVQDLEKVAYEYGNQEVEQEHLLYALLTQEDSLILKLIEKMDINKEYFINVVKKALDAKVKVSSGDLRFGQYLNKSLDSPYISAFIVLSISKSALSSTNACIFFMHSRIRIFIS